LLRLRWLVRHLILVHEVAADESHAEQQRGQRRSAAHMPHPEEEVCTEPVEEAVRGNRVERIVESHARMGKQVRRGLSNGKLAELGLGGLQPCQLRAALLARSEMLLQRPCEFVRKLAVVGEYQIVLCHFALHRRYLN